MVKPKPLKLKDYKRYKNLGQDEEKGEHLGEYLIRKKMITWEILNFCLLIQQDAGRPLGEILIEEGYIPVELFEEYSINRLFNPSRSKSLAKLLYKIGKISKQQVHDLLLKHQKSGRALGSILVDEGIITPGDFTQNKIMEMLSQFEW